ncbi:MAG: hypothetical protein JW727_04365, partial [Candidatus Aenigmarchaeota archaeon]|nr:hypothetical protein [Candidatus Aenigmarchaeota archaeon]
DLVAKDALTGEEIGRKIFVVNVLSEAVGGGNLVGIALAMLASIGIILLYSISAQERSQSKAKARTPKSAHRNKTEISQKK